MFELDLIFALLSKQFPDLTKEGIESLPDEPEKHWVTVHSLNAAMENWAEQVEDLSIYTSEGDWIVQAEIDYNPGEAHERGCRDEEIGRNKDLHLALAQALGWLATQKALRDYGDWLDDAIDMSLPTCQSCDEPAAFKDADGYPICEICISEPVQ